MTHLLVIKFITTILTHYKSTMSTLSEIRKAHAMENARKRLEEIFVESQHAELMWINDLITMFFKMEKGNDDHHEGWPDTVVSVSIPQDQPRMPKFRQVFESYKSDISCEGVNTKRTLYFDYKGDTLYELIADCYSLEGQLY